MLLAIDMGNTQTAMGLFDGDELVQSWRMPTDRSYTADEIHVRLMGFFKMYDLSLGAVDAIAFAGVVPQLSREWHAVADRIAADAIVIGPQTAAVTKLRAARPQAVGADRVANAVAAEAFYGAPAIVVDFGTATNIDVIDEDGYYIGGAIAPGIRISMDALAARAAKLASVPLEAPEHAIGRDTEECIKVGAVMGAAAMAEGLVARMKRELGRDDATVIATGGLAGHRRRFDRCLRRGRRTAHHQGYLRNLPPHAGAGIGQGLKSSTPDATVPANARQAYSSKSKNFQF